MHFLITGHTGFKGSWLSLLLTQLGHTVSGLSLEPDDPSLFLLADVPECLRHDLRGDIRDANSIRHALSISQPDVMIHLAAQPLVRESYVAPRFTMETNVIGTLNVLEQAASSKSLRAILIVTTDKVYRNVGKFIGYLEEDPLGGEDPYSSSKAMADILCQSWVSSFPGPPTAVVRAGNVLGGGDFGKERLVPDLVAALQHGKPLNLRYPTAVRPWQHVLDCLNGYLCVVNDLWHSPRRSSGPWNIGPEFDDPVTVESLGTEFARVWGAELSWLPDNSRKLKEAPLLLLDSSKAGLELQWRNRLSTKEAILWTAEWYARVRDGEIPYNVAVEQIDKFMNLDS